MHPGLSRKSATVELTRPGAQLDAAASSSITSAAITSDGRRIAFITQRTTFVLPSPRLVGDPALTPEQAEVYVLDVDAMEIERATHAWDGSEIDRPTLDGLTISDDGSRIAFASDASNLFFGDGNEKPDAFVVTRAQPGAQDGAGAGADLPFELPPPSTQTRRKLAARISVHVKRTGGGNLSVAVRVTDAGSVEARAFSRVRSSSRQPRSGRAPLRTLATARTNAQRAGEVTLVLRTSKRYRTLMPKRRRLTARLLVSFTPRDGGRKVTVRRNVALQPGSNRK
jgi:hypothetical protein